MRVDRRWCTTFVAVTVALFLTGALLYSGLALWGYLDTRDAAAPALRATVGTVVTAVFAGGWMLGGVVAGVMMFARWIRDRSTRFKVLCGVLFMVVLVAVVFVGLFGWLPMLVYCVVFLYRNRENQSDFLAMDTVTQGAGDKTGDGDDAGS